MDKILDFFFGKDIERNEFCVFYKYKIFGFVSRRGIALFKTLKEAENFADQYEEFEIRGKHPQKKGSGGGGK